jgi:hypothetical protein
MSDLQAAWEQALSFGRFVDECAPQHRPLWEGVHRLARLPEWALDVVAPDAGLKLLVIAEDWCGDASNTTPVLARFAEQVPGITLRVIKRDEHLEIMDRYLTKGGRAIPIVIALGPDFTELGHWGPRPRELQAWVMANKETMPTSERYKEVRKWYAKDHGVTTLREVLAAAGYAVPPG